MSIDYNRQGVITNMYQGDSQRVLCVCSGGVLRSPTAAWVLSNDPYNFNTRSAGTEDYALIKIDEALLLWSKVVVVMEQHHATEVKALLEKYELSRDIYVLDIPDSFRFKDAELIARITKKFDIEESK